MGTLWDNTETFINLYETVDTSEVYFWQESGYLLGSTILAIGFRAQPVAVAN